MSVNVKASESLELVTSAAGTLHVHVSFDEATVDANGFVVKDTYKPDNKNLIITGAAGPYVILDATPTLRTRKIKKITIRNVHPSILNTVIPRHVGTVSTIEFIKATLNPEDAAHMASNGLWSMHEAGYGGIKTAGLSAATDTVLGLVMTVSVTDMEAGTDLNKAVTAGRQHRHPSAMKAWGLITGVATPVLAVGYNVTSVVDTGVGDYAVTVNTDMSSTSWGLQLTSELTSTTYTATLDRRSYLKFNTRTVTAFSIITLDGTATTNVVKDPFSVSFACMGDQ